MLSASWRLMLNRKTRMAWTVLFMAAAQTPATPQTPAPAITQASARGSNPANAVSFSADVAPILSAKCVQCHGQVSLMSNLDLRGREAALKGGQHGPVIVPGDAESSHLYRHLTGRELPQMPLGGRLTDLEIATIKNWIDRGADWNAGVTLGSAAVASAQPE